MVQGDRPLSARTSALPPTHESFRTKGKPMAMWHRFAKTVPEVGERK